MVIRIKMLKVLTALKRDLGAVLSYLVDKDKYDIWNYHLEIENCLYQQMYSE